MNKKLKIRVWESCAGGYWRVRLMEGKNTLMLTMGGYSYKSYAIRRAKQIASLLGISYDTKIIKAHGC